MLVEGDIGFTYAMTLVLLWLSVDLRDVCGRMITGRVDRAGLLAMADEVFEVLYRTHLSCELRQLTSSSALIARAWGRDEVDGKVRMTNGGFCGCVRDVGRGAELKREGKASGATV